MKNLNKTAPEADNYSARARGSGASTQEFHAMTDLHLVLREEDPAFQRALARSKTGARGHIGTHFDCYTTPPESDHFSLPAYGVRARESSVRQYLTKFR